MLSVQELEKDKQQAAVDTPLRFPGKLAVHEAGDRLFITDSSNHRVVVSTLAGQHICSVGGIGAGVCLLCGHVTPLHAHHVILLRYTMKKCVAQTSPQQTRLSD